MSQSQRDRAYEASQALERAAEKLRAQFDELNLVRMELEGEAETLEWVGERIGGPPGQVCKRAARRLLMKEEMEMLNAVLFRITEETVQLIKDADEALQIPLPFSGNDGSPEY